ncbi:MAG: hypothetical protein WDK96_00370 [Candidatus Paceibacterota bacterium]
MKKRILVKVSLRQISFKMVSIFSTLLIVSYGEIIKIYVKFSDLIRLLTS